MKITKFPQSCILVESRKTKLLIDPGTVKFDEKFLKSWKKADAILVTHRHSDHINAVALEKLNVPIYSTKEVAKFYSNLKINIIKNKDNFSIGNINIEVVKAIHGYVLPKGEVKENVGFILDDGNKKLYVTSDTIRFKNNYKADVMFADVTAFDASMNLWGAVTTMKDVSANLLIVAHQDAGQMMYERKQIETYLAEQNINFIVPEILESFEI